MSTPAEKLNIYINHVRTATGMDEAGATALRTAIGANDKLISHLYAQQEAATSLQTERDKLVTAQNQAREYYTSNSALYQQAVSQASAAKAALQAFGQAYGLTKEQLAEFERSGVIPNTGASPNPSPPSNGAGTGAGGAAGVTADDLQRALAYQEIIQGITARHFTLFGKPLGSPAAIREYAIAHQQELALVAQRHNCSVVEAAWRVIHGVDAREGEIATAAREAEETRIRTDERAKVIAEQSKHGGNPAFPTPQFSRSKVFEQVLAKTGGADGAGGGEGADVEKGGHLDRVDRVSAAWQDRINKAAASGTGTGAGSTGGVGSA